MEFTRIYIHWFEPFSFINSFDDININILNLLPGLSKLYTNETLKTNKHLKKNKLFTLDCIINQVLRKLC